MSATRSSCCASGVTSDAEGSGELSVERHFDCSLWENGYLEVNVRVRATPKTRDENISDTRTRDVAAVRAGWGHVIRVGKPCASVTPEPRRQTQVRVGRLISLAQTLSPNDSVSPSRS